MFKGNIGFVACRSARAFSPGWSIRARLRRGGWIPSTLAAAVALAAAPAQAYVTSTGDVSPAPPSTWTNTTNGVVGNTLNGNLRVNRGSKLYSNSVDLGLTSGATGSVTIAGVGSSWVYTSLNVGNFGNGSVTIINGGSLGCNWGSSVLGRSPGSTGTVTIDGAGSLWNSVVGVTVGYSGAGILNIVNGGYLDTTDWDYSNFLGYNPGATGVVTVDGPGSRWDVGLGMGLFIGYSGSGALNIVNGGKVTSSTMGYLGYGAGSAGTATVDGAGSLLWTTDGLNIGRAGVGVLTISQGGMVVSEGSTTLGANGTINFASGGGTLITQSFIGSRSHVTGTGTIIFVGTLDDHILLDATHGLSQTLPTWNGSNQNVSICMDLSGGSGTVGSVGAGYQSIGSLTIRDGVKLTSPSGYLGYLTGSTGRVTVSGKGSTWTVGSLFSIGNYGTGMLNVLNGGGVSTTSVCYIGYLTGSSGTVTVDGSGSIWTTSSTLNVGNSGMGTLNITDGGAVRNSGVCGIGYNLGSIGTVMVDGSGSTWTTDGPLYVGNSGTGMLNISNGGKVTAGTVSITKSSLLGVTVGDGSLLNVGTAPVGNFTNNGILLLKAAPGALPGTYSPVAAGSWSGGGTTQALGGIWDSPTHTFIITDASRGAAGQDVVLDRSQTQRVVITDAAAGTLTAGFTATMSASNLTFNAMPLSDVQASLLVSNLPSGGTVLAGWTMTADGYTARDPVFLSETIGPGYSAAGLQIWHYDGGRGRIMRQMICRMTACMRVLRSLALAGMP